MAEKTVFVKVGAKVDGAVAGLRKVQASVNDLTKSDLKKPQKAFDDLSNKAALAGGLVAIGIGKAVSSFMEFDSAMSAVSANTGAAGADLDALRQKAMQLGADTQFSATEAAQGINELAKAGVSSQEIMNGALQGALDLAAAGQIGVAQAAETTASALNQFEQDGSQATHVADLLANAANAAQGGVGDMGQALGQAGVAAHAAGLDIDETTTLLALFAKAGMIGSDAGTSLKTMMQRLSAPTEKAAGTMEELGIAAYDAQGNFVGAEELLRQLSDATKDMSTQAKMAAFNTIFGSDAIRAASIAAAAGADGYTKMATEVTKAGGAAENAAKLTDNLKGDIERLGGSIETAFISSGSSANDALRTLTQGIGGVVDVVGQLPGPLLLASAGLGGLLLTLPKGVSIYRDFTGALDTMGLSLEKISAKAPRAGRALGLLKNAGVVAGIAAVAVEIQNVSAASEVADVNIDELANSLSGLAGKGQLQGGIADLFRNEGGLLKSREEFVSTSEAIERFNQTAFDALSDGALAATVRMLQPGAEAQFDKYVTQIDAALAQLVSNGHADQAKASLDALLNGIDDPQVRDAARRSFTQYDTAIKGVGTAADGAKGQLDGMNDSTGRTPGSAAGADRAMGDFKSTLQSVKDEAKDAKAELDNLLTLADSMAGNKRDIAAAKAGLADAGDAAIKAAKDKGGYDADALKAVQDAKDELAKARSGTGSSKGQRASADSIARAQLSLKQAQEHLRRVESNGKATASQLESARNRVETATLRLSQAQGKASASGGEGGAAARAERIKRAEDALASANKRLAESYVDPAKAQRDFEESMRRIGEQGDSLIDSLIKQGKPIADINKAYEDQRAALIKAANARGINGAAAEAEADKVSKTKEQMDELRFQYANTQKFVDTQVRTPGIDAAKNNLKGVWEVIDGIPRLVEVTISVGAAFSDAAAGLVSGIGGIAKLTVGPVKKKATGGPIFGPGTGTSDTAGLFALSNNEHIWTAAEVNALGGHARVAALRKAALAGAVQFRATGGPTSVPATAYRSAVVSSGRGTSIDYDRLGAAVAASMPPQVSVYSGDDAKRAARGAIRDWEWRQTQ